MRLQKMNLIQVIIDLIEQASAKTNKPMKNGADFYVVKTNLGSRPKSLQKGSIAVYSFYYIAGKQFLKIGQANRKSAARYNSQHYSIISGRSTLAKSLINDPNMASIINNSQSIGAWIVNNCERYDVIIDGNKHDKLTLNFVEGLLHYYFKPRYERR
mgnify:CR=1 FL=1